MYWFQNVFHDDEWTINDYIEDGDQVAVRYTDYMTYKGGWDSIPSIDQRVKETGIMIIRFEKGIIKEMWGEMSDLDVMNQLRSPN